MQVTFTPPMVADDTRKALGVEYDGASLVFDFTAAFGLALAHPNHGQARKSQFAGIAAVGKYPPGITAHVVPARRRWCRIGWP